MTSRLKNYFLSRARINDIDELPWVRPPGLSKLVLPRPVVLINGCFDLLHPSHGKIIFAAREKAEGGTLVCALDSDQRIKNMKGPTRPIMSWIERATMLGYFPIDYLVEIDNDLDMRELMKAIKPNLRVQGADHKGRKTRFPAIQKMFVREGGLRTSEIIKRIKERE